MIKVTIAILQRRLDGEVKLHHLKYGGDQGGPPPRSLARTSYIICRTHCKMKKQGPLF